MNNEIKSWVYIAHHSKWYYNMTYTQITVVVIGKSSGRVLQLPKLFKRFARSQLANLYICVEFSACGRALPSSPGQS